MRHTGMLKPLVAVMVLGAGNSAWAASNAELEQRVKELERLVAELKAAKSEASGPGSEQLGVRVQTLEKKVAANEKTGRSKLDSLKKEMKERDDKVKVSGFLTTGVTKSDHSFATTTAKYKDDFSWRGDSVIGVQFDYKLTDKATATVQFKSTPYDNFALNTEWAYLEYDLSDEWSVRSGRMRVPWYIYSETLDVRFSQPWARPPIGFYLTTVASYDGFNTRYNMMTGNWNHLIEGYVGATQSKLPSGAESNADDILGTNYELSSGPWLFRLHAARIDYESKAYTSGALTGNRQDRVHIYSGGAMYDDGNWMVIGELAEARGEEFNLARRVEYGYTTLGYHFGDWTPYTTYMATQTLDEPGNSLTPYPKNGNLERFRLRSLSYGLRYNVTDNISTKLQFDKFYGMDGTRGTFFNFDGATSAYSKYPIDQSTNLYSFTVDAVF